MSDVHQLIRTQKMSTIRQHLPFNDIPSVNMIKLERGLSQRSILYCLEKGYFSLIRYLLQSDRGNVDERDTEGRNGLMYCCFIENECWAQNIAMTLLEYGAKIEDQDKRGLNALHYAIITQRPILIRRYLSSLDFDLNRTLDIHGNTCLHYACSTGNADIVRLILNAMKRYSIDLSIKNHYGLTAYDIACQLNDERCQNLLRNEITLREQNELTSKIPNVSHVTIKPLNERRLSIPSRIRPITSTIHHTTSVASVPLLTSYPKILNKRYSSVLNVNNENVVCPPSIFIDPIESRNMILKRNESLDLSLAKQAKNRSDFAQSPLISQSAVFTSSSLTWRDDFSKMIDQLQTYKTPSYRKTIHPPLSNELPCELFEKLYGVGGTDGHDCSNHQPLSPRIIGGSHKIIHRRRSSTASIRSLHKIKK